MNRSRYMYTVASFALATVVVAQAPFSLDTTFRTEIQRRYVNSVLATSDGKVIVSGMMRFPGEFEDFTLVRLLPSGARDETFYNSGLGGGGITPWQDRFYAGGGLVVRRIMSSSGQSDPTYAMGTTYIPYFAPLQPGDYHVYPDGRVLISGKHVLDDTARGFVGNYNLIWFSNTGYLDTTRTHRRGNGVLNRFKELPSGGFVVSGSCTQFEGVPVDGIFLTDDNGVPDTTFHSGVFWGSANEYLPLGDGRLYICGRYRTTHSLEDSLHLARFMSDGSLDPTFSIPHFTLGALPNTGNLGPIVLSVRPWYSGQLLVTGKFQFVNGLPRRGICVMDTMGAVTDAFEDCGVGPFAYMGITNAGVYGLVPDLDSTHYYIWGSYTGYYDGTTNDTLQRFVSRLHVGDFTTETSIEATTSRFSLYPNPSSGSVTMQLEQVPTGATVVVRDALGREVLRRRVTDHYTTIALHDAGSGVYTLELWDASGRIATQRLVLE